MTRRRSSSDKPLRKRSPAERYQARRVLYGGGPDPEAPEGVPGAGHNRIYDPTFHPEDMVSFFRGRYDKILDSIKNVDDKGSLKFVPVPVRPPTFAGYAVKAGVSKDTIFAWSKKHPEFGEAAEHCKAIQEAFFVELGTLGGLNAQMTMFSLKNLQGWAEKTELGLSGHVELNFDDQDQGA